MCVCSLCNAEIWFRNEHEDMTWAAGPRMLGSHRDHGTAFHSGIFVGLIVPLEKFSQ